MLAPPVVLDQAPVRITQPWVGIDDSGAGYAVWGRESTNSSADSVMARFTPGAGWSPPELLPNGISSPCCASDRPFALTADGHLYYARNDPNGIALYGYQLGSGFRQLQTLTTTESVPTLLTDRRGRAIVLWITGLSAAVEMDQINAAYHHPDDSWSTILAVPHALSTIRSITDFRAQSDDQGHVAAIWTEEIDTTHPRLMAAELTEEQGWTAPVLLYDADPSITALSEARNGAALAVWVGGASELLPGAGWRENAPNLDAFGGTDLAVVANDRAQSLVTWTAARDTANALLNDYDLRGASYDAAGWTSVQFPGQNAANGYGIAINGSVPELSSEGTGFVIAEANFEAEIAYFPYEHGSGSSGPLMLDGIERILEEHPDWPPEVSTTFGPPDVAANAAGQALALWTVFRPAPNGPGLLRAAALNY